MKGSGESAKKRNEAGRVRYDLPLCESEAGTEAEAP